MPPSKSLPGLGIVAGGGDIPERLIAACRAQGREFYVIALEGHADPEVFSSPPDAWIRLGQAGKGVRLLREAGAGELVMVGKVRRPSLFELRPDGFTAKSLARIGKAYFGDDSLLTAVARIMEEEGFRIVAPESLLDGILVEERLYGGPTPDAAALSDIECAVAAALEIGRRDIGQAAIARQGRVLGVEDKEGTDALIARCAKLRLDAPGGILVKVCKPGQERRLDLPTIGPGTVSAAAASGLRGIAVEAGGALIVDADEVAAIADRTGIFVVGVPVRS